MPPTANRSRWVPTRTTGPTWRLTSSSTWSITWPAAREKYNLLRSGLTVRTTLDLDMQNLAQQIVRETVDALRPRYNLNNAALLALKPGTAEILAMVGSADYTNDAIGGQVNVVLRQRQPGSAIKPVVYATAIDKGLVSPATLLWDLPVKYPTPTTAKSTGPRTMTSASAAL